MSDCIYYFAEKEIERLKAFGVSPSEVSDCSFSFKKYKRNSFKIVNRRIFLDDEFMGTLVNDFSGFNENEILEYKTEEGEIRTISFKL